MHSKLLLCLFVGTILIHAQAFTVNVTALKCVSDNNTSTFSKGDNATICLHFLNDVQNLRASYSVVVDQYAALTVTGAQATFLSSTYSNTSTGIAMQAYTTNSTSTGIFYIKQVDQDNTNTTTVYTVFSAVINIENGVIQDVYWDNSCYMCSTTDCDSNYYATDSSVSANCYDPTCTTIASNSTCDPKVYVSWIGTDVNGLKMESAGLRISMFKQYSIGDLYATANIIVSQQYNDTSQVYNCKTQGTCT